MKIIHIITDLKVGGTEKVLSGLVLNDQNNQHIIISLNKKRQIGKDLESKNIEVIEINMIKHSLIKSFSKIIKIIKFLEPDIVQTWMYHANLIGGIAAKIAGVKIIFWNVRNSYLYSSSTKTKFINMLSIFFSYLIPKKIIYCSNVSKNLHENYGYRRISNIIKNGYNFSIFYPDEFSRKLIRKKYLNKKNFLIGMVARWDKIKGHNVLLQAASILINQGYDFHLLLIGEGCDQYNNELNSSINKYQLRKYITLCGYIENIPQIINGLDIKILPSLSESFPNVVAESMACGTPCISSEVGDVKKIIGEYGWIVPIGDPISLANKIKEVKEVKKDKIKWRAIQDGCISQINNNYSIEKMVKKYNKLWSSK